MVFIIAMGTIFGCSEPAEPVQVTAPAAAAPPSAREITGPWSNGAYVAFAANERSLHAIWLDGERLVYSTSDDRGGSWSAPETVAASAEAGDGGQMIPAIAWAGGPIVAFTHQHRPWLAKRVADGWTTQPLSTASDGMGALLDLAVVGGSPFVVWLDTRRGPAEHVSDVYAWYDGHEEAVYVDGADGVCMCCRPAAGEVDGRPAAAFRDAEGDVREVRLVVREAGGWSDRGRVTTGGWAPGGCPADGPVFAGGEVVVSDARSGTRALYRGDVAVGATPDVQIMQPRAAGGRVFQVEAIPGEARLVADGRVLARTDGRLEPGDPVEVGDEVWLPWQGADGPHVLAVGGS